MTSAFVHWKSATFVLSRNSNINLILVINILDSCEGYDVIILAHDVPTKFYHVAQICIVGVVM